MMTTYWDLSEAERAALTAEDVQRYVDAELMLKGVLKVKPFLLEQVPVVPEPSTRIFVVRFGSKYGRTDSGVAFLTLEDAKSFTALRPMRVESEYLEGSSVQFTAQTSDPEIAELPIFTEEAKNAVKNELKRAAAIKSSNERRANEYSAAIKAQEEALRGLWEDWTACREQDAKLRAVADTFADYKSTAGGDEKVAASFLAKVYAPELIAEAAARYAIPIETVAGTA